MIVINELAYMEDLSQYLKTHGNKITPMKAATILNRQFDETWKLKAEMESVS